MFPLSPPLLSSQRPTKQHHSPYKFTPNMVRFGRTVKKTTENHRLF